jgi:hypothetical protein
MEPVRSYQFGRPDLNEVTHLLVWYFPPVNPGPVTVDRRGTPIRVSLAAITMVVDTDTPEPSVDYEVKGETKGGAERREIEDGPITKALQKYAARLFRVLETGEIDQPLK